MNKWNIEWKYVVILNEIASKIYKLWSLIMCISLNLLGHKFTFKYTVEKAGFKHKLKYTSCMYLNISYRSRAPESMSNFPFFVINTKWKHCLAFFESFRKCFLYLLIKGNEDNTCNYGGKLEWRCSILYKVNFSPPWFLCEVCIFQMLLFSRYL